MARGQLRGALGGALALIVLQAITTSRGSSAVAGGFDVFAGLADRVFDPNVAAIPDRAHAHGRDEETDDEPAAPAPSGGKKEGSSSSSPNFDKIPGLGD